MTGPTDFQKERREWSKWKHQILKKYLEKMTARLQKYEHIYIVDAFAGPGRYTEDDEAGSPLIAAQLAADLLQKRWYNLWCMNIEQDREVFNNLENATAEYRDFVENFHGDFADFIPNILERISSYPALIFLDPIGLKGIEWSKLAPLLQRGHIDPYKNVTELLIRFDVSRALRDLGFSGKPMEEIHFQRLLDVLGIKDKAEIDSYIDRCDGDTKCRQEQMAEIYQDQLKQYFDHVVRIPIRTEKETLKYFLIFATRHPKGILTMNDALYEVEGLRHVEITVRREATQKQASFFEQVDSDITSELNELKAIILEILGNRDSIRRDDLRTEIARLPNCFGRFSGSEFTKVLNGNPRGLKGTFSKDFQPLDEKTIQLEGAPSGEDTIITLL